MEILKVENLCKTYGSGANSVKALDNVSFQIQAGEFTAIIGPSGSGKSTLLQMISGIDRPTSGRVYINGRNIYTQTDDELAVFRRRHLGFVYQFYNLISVLNVRENIVTPLLLDGRSVDSKRVDALLEMLKLKDREKHLPCELSGGQQQRVSIGRALINHPAILLADEPTGNLDSKNSQNILDLLKYSNRRYNQTILMITHDENIALQADRILQVEDGKITKDEVMLK